MAVVAGKVDSGAAADEEGGQVPASKNASPIHFFHPHGVLVLVHQLQARCYIHRWFQAAGKDSAAAELEEVGAADPAASPVDKTGWSCVRVAVVSCKVHAVADVEYCQMAGLLLVDC